MFSFVDQITAISDGSIRGRFAVPEHWGGAPEWLLIEAIGQLAGWAAMRAADFVTRPVGATVGAIEFGSARRPHGVLDLTATIDRADHRAILYHGEAACGGVQLATMRRCVGPLLPATALDDPDVLCARFAALTRGDPVALWHPGDDLPAASVADLRTAADGTMTADFRVAPESALFADHFPRQHVVPATLLISAMCRLAAESVYDAGDDRPRPVFEELRQVKVRQFTQPGQVLRIEAVPGPLEAGRAEVRVSAHAGPDRVADVRVVCAV